MRWQYKKKRAVFVFLTLLFSFLFALPVVLSAETCAPMPIDTINDLIAAEKIRLGLRMEGVSQPPIIKSGDAADQKKMYAVLNSFFTEPEKAVPVNRHKQRVAAKLGDTLREQSLDSLVEKELAVLVDEYGEDKTLLSLMDLFYLDKETKARNYFSPDKVRRAAETLRVPQEQKQKIVRIISQLGEEIKKRKDAFQQGGMFDIEKMRVAHREALSAVLSSEDVSQSELLDMMGSILARQNGEGSVQAISGRNIENLLQFDEAVDRYIFENDLPKDAKVVGLLGDIEPALSVRMARKGSASPIEMAYVSRSSMMSDGEKLAHYHALHTDPSLALDESLLDQGLVYNKIYRKNRDGTEAGIFVESRDAVRAAQEKGRKAELKFRDDFKTRLEQLLDSDPEFAQEAERIYSQLRLGDEDVVFIDTGFKGTIPTFLAAMHEIKHPNRQALTFLYGVKEDFADVIPHFVIGRKPVKDIEFMGKFSDIGAFSPTDGALVGRTSPKEQLLASIDQFLIGKAGRGHEPVPPQPLRPVPRDVEPLPIQPVPGQQRPLEARLLQEQPIGEGRWGEIYPVKVEGIETPTVAKMPINEKEFVLASFEQEISKSIELSDVITTPTYYGDAIINGRRALIMEEIPGRSFKLDIALDATPEEVLESITDDVIEEVRRQLQRAETQGWFPADVQFKVPDSGRYQGKPVFYDFDKWSKKAPKGPRRVRPADAVQRLQALRARAQKIVDTTKRYPYTPDVERGIRSINAEQLAYIVEELGAPPNIAADIIMAPERALERILEMGIDPNMILQKAAEKGVPFTKPSAPPITIVAQKAKPVVTIHDANAEMLKSAYEKAGTIDERVRLAGVDIRKTEMVSGENVFEIKGTHVDTAGRSIGTGPGGVTFEHGVVVLKDGTVDVSRKFYFHPELDPDGGLVVKALRAEDEQFSAALRSMGVEKYVTEPTHDLELVTLCRLRPCTIEADRAAVLDDFDAWLSSDEAAVWFEQTATGINWVEQHRAGGLWAGVKRLFGKETIDLERLTDYALDYPDAFLRGRKYPVTVDIRKAPVREKAVTGAAPAIPEVTEGALLEARVATPVPAVAPVPVQGRELTLLERPDIPQRMKAELRALGVKNARSVEGRAKLLTRAVEPDSLVDKVLGTVQGGESGVRATIVEKADGSLVVWKVDSGNPQTTLNLHHDQIIGIEDGGRRQLAMAGILDEFDSVVVPGMRRIQFSDGYGVIETDFVEGYQRLGKNSQEQFGRLEKLLRSKAITHSESLEIIAKAQEQALVNIVFGAGDVELGFVRLPHAPGTPASEYLKIVRFDEEYAFLGLLDYGVLHENVKLESLHGTLNSGNDRIFGMFKADDYVTKGVFDIEKLRRKFTPVVENLEGILSREAAFTARLQRAGYTSDEALKIYNNARKNLKALKDEFAVGSPGGPGGPLEKMITHEGNLLATSKPGVFMSADERLDKGLMPLPRRNPLARGNMDQARATKQGVVAQFVPRKRGVGVVSSTMSAPRAPPRPLTSRERSMIGFVDESGLSVDYRNAWNAAKAGKDVKIKRYGDYYRAKYAGDNAYLADGILAEARPEFVVRIDAIADEFNALPLAERQGRVDEFIGRMEDVIQGKGAKAAPSPEIVAANRAALGSVADNPKLRAALDDLTVPITCGVPFVTGRLTGLAVSEPCTQPTVIIRNPVEHARAIRVQMAMDELGLPKLRIDNAEAFVETLDNMPAIDYDILQAMRALGLDSENAAARFDGLKRIAAAYKAEVGFLDAGQPTPQLAKLVDEGVLTPDELEKLRKGAPMVMGGMTKEDLRKAAASQRAVAVPLNDAPLEQLVTAERPDPDAIMQRLSGLFPDLRQRFDASAGVREGYTIREHTHRVYDAFSEQATHYPFDAISVPEGADVPRLMKTAIALHDIGKPDAIAAGGKHLQHEFTVKILTEKLRALGFSDAETNLAEALVGNDVIGDLVKQLITEKQAYEQIAALAKKAGMPPDDFYLLQKLFYVSDASSYPLLEQEVFKKIGQSTRLDNRELLQFEKEYFPVARNKQSMHFMREEARRRGYAQLAARYDTFIRDEQLGVPAYYHTTTKDNLEGLFSGGSIEVRSGKAVPGAWVSNKPVTGVPYDNFVLILDDRLDMLPALYSDKPPLVQAFSTGEEWFGFQVPIPFRQHLVGIIVPEEEIESVQKLLRSHGVNVPVFNTEEGLTQAEIYHTLNTFLKPEKEGILIPHSFEDAFPRAGKTEEDIRSYFTSTLSDQGRRGQLAGRVFVLPDSVGVVNHDALGGTLFEFARNPASGKWEFVTKRRIIFEGASSADRVNLVDEIIIPAMRKGDAIFSDEDTRVGLKSGGEIKEIENELGNMKFSSLSLPTALPSPSTPFPVTIPPGAAKIGFEHLEELHRLNDAGKSEQAWRYFIKFKDELLPEDAAKLEPFLQKNYLIQRAKVGDLEAWLGTPAGHSFLATPEGKVWYDTHKQNWLISLFQRGTLKKSTLETPDAFPSAFIGRSKYAPKPGRELEVNSKTDAVFISAGDPGELFTPENMRAASSETNGLPGVTFIIDGKEGKEIRIVPYGGSKLPYEGDIQTGVLLDEAGGMLSSLSSRIRGGKLNQDEPFPERLLTEFNRQAAAYKKRYFSQESFDYDSLQVLNILGISPEAAKARDVQRIAAAYKAEVGLLDSGAPTPQLTKLIDDGLLTPDELEKLRKGAPMVMGGEVEIDKKIKITTGVEDTLLKSRTERILQERGYGEFIVQSEGKSAEIAKEIYQLAEKGEFDNALQVVSGRGGHLNSVDISRLRDFIEKEKTAKRYYTQRAREITDTSGDVWVSQAEVPDLIREMKQKGFTVREIGADIGGRHGPEIKHFTIFGKNRYQQSIKKHVFITTDPQDPRIRTFRRPIEGEFISKVYTTNHPVSVT